MSLENETPAGLLTFVDRSIPKLDKTPEPPRGASQLSIVLALPRRSYLATRAPEGEIQDPAGGGLPHLFELSVPVFASTNCPAHLTEH
jgi:hypothetical protein